MRQQQSENQNISQEATDQMKSIELNDQELDLVVGGKPQAATGGKLHESACKGTHIPEVTIDF
jgi:hypothetical protein